MIFKNAMICNENFDFVKTDLVINDDLIEYIGETDKEGIDCEGKVILPGFVDIHIHGCNGADCTDLKKESVLTMSNYLASVGVTSFCPATMTIPEKDIITSFEYIRESMGKENGARILGVNMEGPFISPKRKGAQDEQNIRIPDVSLFKKLNSICNVCLVDIAPEAKNADEFIKEVSGICTVSAAHTELDYAGSIKAFERGVSHCTHLFNAMNQMTSREPGLIGAVLDSDNVTAELICDGIHISPAMLRIAFRLLGENRSVVISDAMMASGLTDGEYTLGGQRVIKKGAARLSDGTLAGSATNLFEEFCNLILYNIPIKQVIKSLTINPARVVGREKNIGSIAPGKKADFLITDLSFSHVESTYRDGKKVF